MKFIVFIILAYITGFLSAVPAGPIQIEVIRRSVNGHLRSSFLVISGALASDIVYGIIAFFGVAPFLKDEKIMATFWLTGSAILFILGTLIIRQSQNRQSLNQDSLYLRKKRWALIGGFSISATNPVMILWWLISAKIFMDIKLIDDLSPNIAVSFLAAGGLGLASYLIFLSLLLFWAKQFISDKKIHRINLTCGIVLLFIGLYFLYTSLDYFLKLY